MAKTPGKSKDAFRTIREVADWLGVPTHVLRFWESKFDQVAPVKGAGGRRYYRPEDMRLLGGIKVLLHDQGQTIRGVVQKIDDEGADPVRALSQPLASGSKGAPAPEDPAEPEERAQPDVRPEERVVPFARKAPADAIDATQPDPPAEVEAAPVPDGLADAEPGPEAVPAEPDLPQQPDVPDLPEEDVAPAPEPTDEVARSPDVPEPPAPSVLPAIPGAPPQPEPGTDDAAMEAPVEHGSPPPPSATALALVRGADGCSDPRRLRRVVRRMRGLIAEIEEDLAS